MRSFLPPGKKLCTVIISSSSRSAAAALLAVAAIGCGDDGGTAGDAGSERSGECRFGAQERRAAFRPLPAGLRYRPLPESAKRAAERRMGEGFLGFEGRRVAEGRRPTAVVLLQVVDEPLKNENDYLRGAASAAGGDAEPETADFGGGTVTRIRGDTQVLFVRIFAACRVVSVLAPAEEDAERVARAVLG